MPDVNTVSGSNPSALGSVLKKGLGAINPAMAVLQGGSQILNMIGNHQEDLGLRKQAAGVQGGVEQAAFRIQDLVNSGQMDVDAGLQALDALEASINAQAGGSTQMAAGAGTARVNIAQVRMNLQNNKTHSLSASPLNPDGNKGNLTGTPNTQLNKMGTGIRNYFTGSQQGNEFVNDTPLADLMKPVAGPMDRLPDLKKRFDEQFPSVIQPAQKRKDILY